MKQKKNEVTTSQLLSYIKKSEQFTEVAQFIHEVNNLPVFHNYLYEVMEKHSCSAKDVTEKSRIERSYFYHLLSGQRKNPSRNIVIRIALCIQASLNETQQMLRLASTGTLYPKVERDAAIIYAIENKYSMEQTNQLLLSRDLTPLYKEESK